MDCFRSPTTKIEGGNASADAPNPSLQLLTRSETSSHSARLGALHRGGARGPPPPPQPVPALRELAHLLQERNGTLEHPGEIEQRMRLERPLILVQRDGKDPPHAARHDDVQV